jgi:glutamyl-tRNA synthetase
MIAVRFAPSPTGYLHVGGARTALFNFLYARNQEGRFLLRIEDTDRERSKPEFEKEILDSLSWLDLAWDGKPVRQSERIPFYQKEAERLLADGKAYEETKEGKRAILFRVPKREIKLYDVLRGEVVFNTEIFEDIVLIKSDGFPTYHWACVLDDHEMGISHVIRGEDHLSNTPKQILLIEAMGWKPPTYVHLPLILGTDGTPLSKRHGAVSVTNYRQEGFLPEGLDNYLALLGWGAPENQEFFTLAQLIQKFTLKKLIHSAARFNLEKLRWINAQHLRALSERDYLAKIREYYQSDAMATAALLFRGRIQTLKDLETEASYFFKEVEEYDLEAMNRSLGSAGLKEKLVDFKKSIEPLPDFKDTAKMEVLLRESAARNGAEAKTLIHPLRLALTGKGVSPGIFELMKALGKEVCLRRLDRLIERL